MNYSQNSYPRVILFSPEKAMHLSSEHAFRAMHRNAVTDLKSCFCGESNFESYKLLLQHVKQKHNAHDPKDSNLLKCPYRGCNHTHYWADLVLLHGAEDAGYVSYSCETCSKSFDSASNCVSHSREHGVEKSDFRTCYVCHPTPFPDKEAFYDHFFSSHFRDATFRKPGEETEETFKCTQCNGYLPLSKVRDHINLHVLLHMLHGSFQRNNPSQSIINKPSPRSKK